MARTISFIQAISAGNALRIGLYLPPGASFVRLLRQPTDAFAGPDDASALVVAEHSCAGAVIDITSLTNGTPVFYCAYVNRNGAWDDGCTASGTPAATYCDGGPDVQEIVRSRVEAGLAVEVARGAIRAPKSGVIPVVDSPYALADRMVYPYATVHFDRCTPSERYLGEDVTGVGDDEGFLATTALNVAVVTQNPDERILLRKALNRILLANFDVFGQLGLLRPTFSLADSEQLPDGTAGAVMFMSGGSFTCDHLTFVTARYPLIADVALTAHPHPDLFGSFEHG